MSTDAIGQAGYHWLSIHQYVYSGILIVHCHAHNHIVLPISVRVTDRVGGNKSGLSSRPFQDRSITRREPDFTEIVRARQAFLGCH